MPAALLAGWTGTVAGLGISVRPTVHPSAPIPPARTHRAVNTGGVPQAVTCTFTLSPAPTSGSVLKLDVQAVRTITGRPKNLYSNFNEDFTYTFPDA